MKKYDVIIIGTGAGGGTMALKLAPTGKQILILERGQFLPKEVDNWNQREVYTEGKYRTKEYWYDVETLLGDYGQCRGLPVASSSSSRPVRIQVGCGIHQGSEAFSAEIILPAGWLNCSLINVVFPGFSGIQFLLAVYSIGFR